MRSGQQGAVGNELQMPLDQIGLLDTREIDTVHGIEIRPFQEILIGGDDDRVGARQEHHADGDGHAGAKAQTCPTSLRVYSSTALPCESRVIRFDSDGVSTSMTPNPADWLNWTSLLVDLAPVAGDQQGAVGGQARHRLEDEPRHHAERSHERGAVEPLQKIDLAVELADQRERRVEDEPLADARDWRRPARAAPCSAECAPSRSCPPRAPRSGVDGDNRAGGNAQSAGVHHGVAVLGPRRGHRHRHAGGPDVPAVGCGREEDLTHVGVGNHAQRVGGVGDGGNEQLACGVPLVVDGRRRLELREPVQVVERRIDAEGLGAVPQHQVVPIQLALGELARFGSISRTH